MILCMETNKKAATDYIYIKETIQRFYICNNQIKLSPLFMNGKSRYNSKEILRSIKKFGKDYTSGVTQVVYCIDTDLFEINADHEREMRETSKFCDLNNFELIWFCHDIEEVYLGRKIVTSQKVQEAGDFRRKNKIQSVSADRLSELKPA